MKNRLMILALAGCVFGWSATARAATITFEFSSAFSDDSPAGSTTPWIQATFTDIATDTVQLTISTTGLVGTEFVDSVYFSINPDSTASSLSFAWDSTSDRQDADGIIKHVADTYKADGDGFFDLLFEFETSDSSTLRFTSGLTSVYTITGTGISASAFLTQSEATGPGGQPKSGDKGPFYAAAHIQSISGGKSAWISGSPLSVPEDCSPLVLGLVAAGLLYTAKRQLI